MLKYLTLVVAVFLYSTQNPNVGGFTMGFVMVLSDVTIGNPLYVYINTICCS